MPSEIARQEFEARVGVLEREVQGERLVTRHILEQSRRNGDDLAAVKARMGRVEGRLDEIAEGVRSLKTTVDGLTHTLPKIVREAVRSALPKRSKRGPD